MMIIIAGFASTASGNGKAVPVVIDVRTSLEYKMGHLEGAINIPHDEIGKKIGSLVPDKSRKIYVYCRSGSRSKKAKESLEKLGYNNIVDLGTMKNAANALNLKIIQ
jgi:phage shock protein E